MNKWIQARVSQLWTIDIWGQKILCGGGLCVVNPWHAPTRFQGHLFPHLGWPKTSQNIVRCSQGGQNAPRLRNSAVGRNNPWLWWHRKKSDNQTSCVSWWKHTPPPWKFLPKQNKNKLVWTQSLFYWVDQEIHSGFLHSPTLTSIHDYWKDHSPDYTNLCWQSNVSALQYAI